MAERKIVAINAGHWEGNAKGVPSYMPILAGTREWTLNKRVVDKFVELAQGYNFDVLENYDKTGKTTVNNTLNDRIKMAEKAKACIYLSVHHNGGINGGKGGGTVVYHYNSAKNKAQATNLYNQIKSRTGLKGNRSNPICANNSYTEIYKPTMPSFIIECGFMDSVVDIYKISESEWATHIAEGILAFLCAEFGFTKNGSSDTNKSDTTTTTTTTTVNTKTEFKSYKAKVLIATLPIYKGPGTSYQVVNYIRDKGTYTIVDESNGFGKLKSGAGWVQLSYVKKL